MYTKRIVVNEAADQKHSLDDGLCTIAYLIHQGEILCILDIRATFYDFSLNIDEQLLSQTKKK